MKYKDEAFLGHVQSPRFCPSHAWSARPAPNWGGPATRRRVPGMGTSQAGLCTLGAGITRASPPGSLSSEASRREGDRCNRETLWAANLNTSQQEGTAGPSFVICMTAFPIQPKLTLASAFLPLGSPDSTRVRPGSAGPPGPGTLRRAGRLQGPSPRAPSDASGGRHTPWGSSSRASILCLSPGQMGSRARHSKVMSRACAGVRVS